ncbi:MAG: hypothetical protein N2315_05835 [Thermanaerothrix sp.]|nr:hypothetical protein [Thermanaerothrix sp.]
MRFAMLKVTLAGPASVELNGERVRFPFRKLEAMAYVLFDQSFVSRDRLCRLLWGDKDLPLARKNLRNAVYVLRRLLPPGMLSLQRDLVALEVPEGAVDLHMMDRFLEISDDDRDGLGREFLEGFDLEEEEFRSWLAERRLEHRRRFTALAKELAAELLRRGDQAGATRWFERAFSMDPLDEAAARSLMELYHRSGWSAGPVEVFNTLKDRLARDYGIMPSPETVELFNRISASRRAFNDFHAIVPPMPAAVLAGSPKVQRGGTEEAAVTCVAGPNAFDLAVRILSQEGGSVDLIHLPSPSPNPLLSALEVLWRGELTHRIDALKGAETAEAVSEALARRAAGGVLVNLRDRPEGECCDFLSTLLAKASKGRGLRILVAAADPLWLSCCDGFEIINANQGSQTDWRLDSLWGVCLSPLGAVWEEIWAQDGQGGGHGELVVSCRDPLGGDLWLAPRDETLRRKALGIMPECERRRRAQGSLAFWLGRCLSNHLDVTAWEMGAFYGGLVGDALVEGYCSSMGVRARMAVEEAGIADRPCGRGFPSEEEIRRARCFLRSCGPALERVKRLALRVSPL